MTDPGRSDLYAQIVEGSADTYLVVDASGTIGFANRSVRSIVGYAPDEVVGRNIVDFLHPDELEVVLQAFNEVGAEWGTRPGEGSPTRLRIRQRDGSWLPVSARAQMSGEVDLASLPGFTGVADPSGVILQVRVAGTEAGLRKSLAALAASAPLAVVFAELASSIAYEVPHSADVALAWNEPAADTDTDTDTDEEAAGASSAPSGSFTAVRSCLADSVLDRSGFSRAILRPEVPLEQTIVIDAAALPASVRTVLEAADVTTLWLHHLAVGDQLACIVIARTIPGPPWTTHDLALERASSVIGLALEQQRTAQLLRFAAQNDNLTGLANRASFFRAIEQILDAPEEGGFAVVYLDLDGFKPVNDTWGHPAGDAILRDVAARLRVACRPTDVIARLGGDEFAVLCPGVAHADAAAMIGQRIIDVMEPVFELEVDRAAVTASVGASVGVVFVGAGDATLTTDMLIDLADTELYAVKHAGGRAVRVHAVPAR